MVGAAAALGYGVLFFRRKARHLPAAEKPDLAASLLAVSLLPIAWYLFASNHTYNHAFFASRALCVTVFAIGSALIARLPAGKETSN